MDKSQAKQLVIKAGRELSQTGLIARTWGNVSCRIAGTDNGGGRETGAGDGSGIGTDMGAGGGRETGAGDGRETGAGDGREIGTGGGRGIGTGADRRGNDRDADSEGAFVITASGRNYMTLTEQEVVEVNISDLSYQGGIKPSSEKKVHREIYKLRPDVNFIIHTHQDNASAVAAMGSGTIKLMRAYEGLGDELVIADYGLPGTEKLCKSVAAAACRAKGNAIIMANHGTVCYGKNYEEAFAAAHMLERACGEYLTAKMPDKKEYFALKVTGVDLDGLNDLIRDKASRGSDSPVGKVQDENTPQDGLNQVDGDDIMRADQQIKKHDGIYRLTNNSKPVADFSKLNITLRPYVDDFAQIVGTKVKPGRPGGKALPVELTEGGAICYGETSDDAEAVSMILTKNCMAYFAAQAAGAGNTAHQAAGGNGAKNAAQAAEAGKAAKPISRLDCVIMRRIYLKKYSKQINSKI